MLFFDIKNSFLLPIVVSAIGPARPYVEIVDSIKNHIIYSIAKWAINVKNFVIYWVNMGRIHIKDSVKGVGYVLRRPLWIFLAAVIGFLIATLIYFSINIGFYGSIFAALPFTELFYAFSVMTHAMVQSFFADGAGVLLLVVSILQGITLSVLIFTIRRNKKMDATVVGRSGFALVLATLGLGCVPCGTSLLIPVMTLIFSSSAPALMGTANTIILVGALALTLFSLYKIGIVAYKYKISEV